MRDLDVLVGTWIVEEKHKSGWWEKGERTCSMIMNDTYMECETKAISSEGKSRVYRFLINYNPRGKRFEMTGIYSNWPLKQIDAIAVDSSARVWTLHEIPLPEETTERRATIRFADEDNYVWAGSNFNTKTRNTIEYVESGKRKVK